MHTRCTRIDLLALAFIAVGCSAAGGASEGREPSASGRCTPGELATCACPNGTGVHECNAQGSFDACQCGSDPGTGGSAAGTGGSSAGTSGTGGVAGTGGVSGTGGVAGTGGSAGAGAGGVGGTGGGGTGGVAGTGGTVASCPTPPADAPDLAVQAWTTLNQVRLAAGSGCMNLVPTLNASSQAHCNYHVANASNPSCLPDAHTEVSGCTGYTGATVQAREVAAGYPSSMAYTEVATTYGNNPTSAVPSFIDTVYHRIPLLDPWTVDMGYGGAVDCDVIDIGRGTSSTPADAIVLYPYDGQANVPPAWSGREAPTPPAPAGGYPSSYPISIYAQAISVTEHVLTKDGDPTPLAHVWLDYNSSLVSSGLKPYFRNTAMLYGAPFALSTKYRVKIVGTHTGGAFSVEWTFTTGATRPWGT